MRMPSSTRVSQARPALPLMTMAQDPQVNSRQFWRKATYSPWSHSHSRACITVMLRTHGIS